MATKKNEAVTVSFHYLSRTVEVEGAEPREHPFTIDDFSALFSRLASKPQIDVSDEASANRLRFRQDVPIDRVVRIDDRTIFGTYRASYWGHAYENTERGTIPADSISLRPFHFVLYLSRSGRIYLGSQYLGLFGGYLAIQRTISSLLGGPGEITSRSFRLSGAAYRGASPREVKVTFANKSHSIASGNQFGNSGVVVFKKTGKTDGFEDTVTRRLFPFLGRPISEIKRAVAELTNESQLIAVQDRDIEDCSIVAIMDGKRRNIPLIEKDSFATRFPLNVPLNADGHPEFDPTRVAMTTILRDEIIAINEDV